MSERTLRIDDRDNVAVALDEIAGRDRIPRFHKIALRAIEPGEHVIKYGHPIGTATERIEPGSWVHTHNMRTNLTPAGSYTYKPAAARAPAHRSDASFLGFRRVDGRVGTRNEIWIVPTVGCVAATAQTIAARARERFGISDVSALTHPFGCSQLGDDHRYTRKVLAELIAHPNAGGVLVLALGCEDNQLDDLMAAVVPNDRERIRTIVSQDADDEIERGLEAVGELLELARADRRETCPLADLVLGVKCGGSDALSGITANPLVGRIADVVAGAGGAVLLTEVPEMFGAEELLMERAKDAAVFDEIVSLITWFKQYYVSHGQPVHENPSPGNRAGGITTLEEKSLGAIQKGGTATVTQVCDYGERYRERGLVLVKAPGDDGASATALVASGATLVLFTTGRGTPMGLPVPAVKISSNTELWERKKSWIDFNAGAVADGTASIGEFAGQLLEVVLDVASGGRRTRNELRGAREIAIWKHGMTV